MGGPAHMTGSYETCLACVMLTQAPGTEVELGDELLTLHAGKPSEFVAEIHTIKLVSSVAAKRT